MLSSYEPAPGSPTASSASDGDLWTYRTYMVIAAIGTVLAAGYLLWMLQRVAFGKPKPEFEHAHIHDVHAPEWIAWAPLLVAHRGARASTRTSIFSMTDGAVTHIARGSFGGE